MKRRVEQELDPRLNRGGGTQNFPRDAFKDGLDTALIYSVCDILSVAKVAMRARCRSLGCEMAGKMVKACNEGHGGGFYFRIATLLSLSILRCASM